MKTEAAINGKAFPEAEACSGRIKMRCLRERLEAKCSGGGAVRKGEKVKGRRGAVPDEAGRGERAADICTQGKVGMAAWDRARLMKKL
jgi:hypothetical protein